MADDKKTVEVKGLGTVELIHEPTKTTIVDGNEKPGKPGAYRLPDADLFKFYENHGIPNAKAVMKTVNTARKELALTAAEFLAKQVEKTGADWELRMGTGDNGIKLSCAGQREVRNVRTGEKTTQYGCFTMRINAPSPFDEKPFQQMSADIEKAIRAGAGL